MTLWKVVLETGGLGIAVDMMIIIFSRVWHEFSF